MVLLLRWARVLPWWQRGRPERCLLQVRGGRRATENGLRLRYRSGRVLLVARTRPDGWPICPSCGFDELLAATDSRSPPAVEEINHCYRCGPVEAVGDEVPVSLLGRDVPVPEPVRLTVYAVVYSNYDPPETDSIYATRELACARAKQLNERDDTGMWEVMERMVRTELPADDE